MFGFKRRHDELCDKIDGMHLAFDEVLVTLRQILDNQDPIDKKVKDLNESVLDNATRLNNMMNEFKGCVAMSRASLPKRDDVVMHVERDKPKKAKK
ncbi:MAG TPA: hypothetical protein VGF75_07390 [Candidatus Saccharimonadales bacterium]